MADLDAKPKKTKGSLDVDATDPRGTSLMHRAFRTPGGDPWRMPQDLPWSGVSANLDVKTEDATRSFARDIVDVATAIGKSVWEAGPGAIHAAYAGEIDPLSKEGQEKARETAFLMAGQGPAGAAELGERHLVGAAREIGKDYYAGTEQRAKGVGSIAEAYHSIDPAQGQLMGIGPWGITPRDVKTGIGAAKAVGQDVGDIAHMLWQAGPQAIHDVLTGKLDPMSQEGQEKARNLALLLTAPSPVRGASGAGVLQESLGPVFHGAAREWPAVKGAPMGRFDPKKIGTGEGESFHGYGANVTKDRTTAEIYANKEGEGKGVVYELEYPGADTDEFMHMRNPVGKQTKQVKDALVKAGYPLDKKISYGKEPGKPQPPDKAVGDMTGFQIYQLIRGDLITKGVRAPEGLSWSERNNFWQHQVTEVLRKAGLKGTKSDAGDVIPSRKGHENYVVFTPKNMKVVAKHGLAALLGIEGASELFGDEPAQAATLKLPEKPQDRVKFMREYYAAHPGEA